jgi:hypothetical protein
MPRDLAQAWQALFDKARDVRADLPPADIQVSGDQAEARVNGTLSYVEEGSGSRKSTPLRFTAELTRRGSAWIITSVQWRLEAARLFLLEVVLQRTRPRDVGL